ncbi:MAG: hypothetical protein WD334_08800, partial [Chitinophagales bacterium]
NSDLLPFYEYLKKLAPAFPPEKTTRKKVFAKLYPKQAFDEKQFNYLMSFTLKLAEEFLAHEHMKAEGIALENYMMNAFLERDLDKHYRYIFNKTDKKLENQNWRDTDYYYNRYLMAHTDNQYFLQQKIRKYDDRLQKASDHLDHFYLCAKLRYFCEMLDRKKSLAAEYDLHFLEEVKKYASDTVLADIPPVKIYYQLLLMLENDTDDRLFTEFKALVEKHRQLFPREEVKDIYAYAINYCIRKINHGNLQYLEELFSFYHYAIDKNLLLENDHLSPWAFKNMVGVGLRLKKFDWAENFIKTYHKRLHPDFQQNALHYNLAELYYYNQDHDRALTELNKVSFSDVYYHLDTKKLMLKIYYEQEEIDAFYSLSAAFKMLLKRNKLISSSNKKAYENFVSILGKMIRKEVKLLPDIEIQIKETELLADRKWLKEQWGQMSEKNQA